MKIAKLKIVFVILFCIALQGTLFSQEKIEKPAEVKDNKGINTFVDQAFVVYDSTLVIPAQVDSLDKDVSRLEQSIKESKSDVKSTVSETVSDASDTKLMSAETDIDSTKQKSKEDVENKIKEREDKIAKLETSSKDIQLSIETLKKRTEEMITESPANSADAVNSVKVGLKAAKEIKQIKNNAKVALQTMNASKDILIAQSKRVVEINKRIVKLKTEK